MEGVKFSKRPKLKNPYLLCAWPGMGEVAFKAAMYLIGQLKAEEFAEIPPEDFLSDGKHCSGRYIERATISLQQILLLEEQNRRE